LGLSTLSRALLTLVVTLGMLGIIAPSRLDPQGVGAIAHAQLPRVADPRGNPSELRDSVDTTSLLNEVRARREHVADPRGWSAVGLDGGNVEGLVATDGTFSADPLGPGFTFWLRDDATGKIFQPTSATVTQSLVGGHLPLIRTVWSAGNAVVTWTVFAQSTGPDPIGRLPSDVPLELVQTTVMGPGSWTLYLVAQPSSPTHSNYPITRVGATSTSLTINGQLMLVATRRANVAGAIDQAHRDSLTLAGPASPPSVVSDYGFGMGFLGYNLHLTGNQTGEFSFALPLGDTVLTSERIALLSDLNVAESQKLVENAWKQRLQRVEVTLPDEQLANAFYASIAYMLMARGEDTLFSGPTSEHAVWVRDSAYITAALTRAGQARVVEPVLRKLVAAQLPSGREPPIIEADGTIRKPVKTEWDAQGELIFALVDYTRETHNPGFLREVYPSIRKAAMFQEEQLAATRRADLRGTPFYGILPAGESAEDLYDATWHHYWDDFWALTGFHEAADAAQQLGYLDDARAFSAEEASLRQDVLASLDAIKKVNESAYIPNGPEDVNTTAMARSGTPAIWPVEVLDPKSPLVRHSFDLYYERAIAPYGGAYRHYGNDDWPYAGLGLAHAFYRLGLDDRAWQILDWTMNHQTAPNLYAWGEVVDPEHFGVLSGDVPHSWMAAEMVLFIRDILLRQQGDRLEIGPFPSNWLAPGSAVSVRHLPTSLGDQGYAIERSADGRTIQITFDSAGPAGGYLVTLPADLSIGSAATPGGALAVKDPHRVLIPATAREATLTLADSPGHK
jgi:hypothetical protein